MLHSALLLPLLGKRKEMAAGVRFGGLIGAHVKRVLRLSLASIGRQREPVGRVPKGHFAVYAGETERRFVVPVAYLEHPLFRVLLRRVEEEYGFDQPRGGLRLPCNEDYFAALVLQMRRRRC